MIIASSLNDPQIVALLSQGAVGVLPTDTIYGLVARAADEGAVARLYELKRREAKPGTLIAAQAEQLIQLGLDERIVRAVQHLWPNALSIVVPTTRKLRYLDQGLGDLAVRIPNDDVLSSLLQQTGPLITSSANLPGKSPAINLHEAQDYFGDWVDFYVDGGERGSSASTVVRYRDGHFETLRPGPVAVSEDGRLV